MTRDGQGIATANLPMGGFRHTGVGDGVALSDYSSLKQASQGLVQWTIAGGTADAITASYTPAHTALVDGMLCAVRAGNSNATTTPTFAPDGLTAHTITKAGGAALLAGDIAGNLVEIILRYNLANTRWELLNPAASNILQGNPTGTVIAFAGTSPPTGYLTCDGSSQLRAGALAALFAVIGTTYGSADGTHFNLPDLRGRVIASIDSGGSGRITVAGGNFDGTAVGNAGGAQNQTIAQANLPNVNFTNSGITLNDPGHTHSTLSTDATNTTVGGAAHRLDSSSGSFPTASATTGITISAQGHAASGGSGTALPDVQPTMMMLYCIKT